MLVESAALCDFYTSVLDCFVRGPLGHQLRSNGQVIAVNARPSQQELELFAKSLQALFIPAGNDKHNDQADTWIFPTIQIGSLDIRQEESVTSRLLSLATNSCIGSPPRIDIAAGYCNLPADYRTILASSISNIRLLTASPQANGFYCGCGFAKYIPSLYQANAYSVLREMEAAGNSSRVGVYQYTRPNWTFHSKGLWLTAGTDKQPVLTTIGSSNLASRSLNRDIESSLVLLTKNQNLHKDLHQEVTKLFEYGERMSLADLDHAVTPAARAAARLFNGFL